VVTPIDNGGMIQFTAPSNDGGSSITNYEYSVDNGVSWVTPSPAITASPLIITSGLTNCTSYQVMLRAVNISGSGASSSVEKFVPGQSMGIGINWIACTQATDNYWRSVTYGNGLFVAVSTDGPGNQVMTSPDGINWTARASAVNNIWLSVTYGNGLFVAVSADGMGNRVMTSPDGINWTSRASAVDNSWQSVTYGNGIFVAVGFGEGGNQVMTSSYSVVVDAPVIVSIDARNEGTKVTFSNTASAFAPQIINYEYSIDRGSNWITLSSGANVSPMVIYDLPLGKSTIMLRGVNSIGNSCPSNIFSLVPGINILAYPNPTRGDVGLELNGFDVGEAEIRLLDLSGKLLLTQKVALKTGLHLVSLQLKNLIIGNYIVQVVQHGKYYSTRFTKM
jgi:hypothetical protein